MLVSDVQTLIQDEGYGTDTSAIQIRLIARALRRLYGMRRWNFLMTEDTNFSATVANSGIVSIAAMASPSGASIKLDSVRITFGTDYENLTPRTQDRILELRHLDPAPGFPTDWSRIKDTVVVWPIPDQTYPLKIVRFSSSTLPTTAADTVNWPEAHMDVVVNFVLERLARRQRDRSQADIYHQEYLVALNAAFADDSILQRQAADHIEQWPGWASLRC